MFYRGDELAREMTAPRRPTKWFAVVGGILVRIGVGLAAQVVERAANSSTRRHRPRSGLSVRLRPLAVSALRMAVEDALRIGSPSLVVPTGRAGDAECFRPDAASREPAFLGSRRASGTLCHGLSTRIACLRAFMKLGTDGLGSVAHCVCVSARCATMTGN